MTPSTAEFATSTARLSSAGHSLISLLWRDISEENAEGVGEGK